MSDKIEYEAIEISKDKKYAIIFKQPLSSTDFARVVEEMKKNLPQVKLFVNESVAKIIEVENEK